MIRPFLLLFWLGMFLHGHSQNDKSPFFEGIIEYDVKAESFIDGVTDNELTVRFGSKVRFYFKNGSYLREYLDEAGYTIRTGLYEMKTNRFYFHFPLSSPDTLYYNVANDSTYASYTLSDSAMERVLGCDVHPVVVNVKIIPPDINNSLYLKQTFFFCPSLPINPEWQKGIYIWNKVIAANPFIAIKFAEETIGYNRMTHTATKIEWKKLDDSLFEPDPKLFPIKMKIE
jgi:hypothetical protein